MGGQFFRKGKNWTGRQTRCEKQKLDLQNRQTGRQADREDRQMDRGKKLD